MDDNIQAGEEISEPIESEENTQEESPTTEQTPEETTEEASEEVETEESPKKKGFQSRVKELVKERDEYKGQAQSLAQRLAEISGQVDQGVQTPYLPQYQPGEEIAPERLQNDVVKTADAMVQLRIKQSEATNRIRNESLDVIRAYPELDPDSDSFDRELSETVTEAVEAQVRNNPYTASVRGFVDRMMKPYQRAVAKEVGKATENIAKQVSETALRPTSVRKQEKTAGEKSIAELEAELGVIQA